jgi:SMI1-KNR4 cell-wall
MKESNNIIKGLGQGANSYYIDFVEQNLKVNFPKNFINLVKKTDQGTLKNPYFNYTDPYTKKMRVSAVGAFSSFNPKADYNILRQYFLMPSFFPRHLIPFAEVGNGDLICFDYSIDGFEDLNPPIVYWIHDNPEGYEIADVAINFEEFINNLKSDEEVNSIGS